MILNMMVDGFFWMLMVIHLTMGIQVYRSDGSLGNPMEGFPNGGTPMHIKSYQVQYLQCGAPQL